VSLRDRLHHPDDDVRLEAAIAAGRSGDLGLVDALLDLALHDDAEVRTAGGMAETYEHVGDAAANALATLLAKVPSPDPRIRAAALDLSLDDDRVASLLFHLGTRCEPLRAELEGHPEGRVRLRAVRALVSDSRRDRAFSTRFLADGAPELRVEALKVPWRELDFDAVKRALLEDPDARVRRRAAVALRYHDDDSAPLVAAAPRETDPSTRAMILSCLLHRQQTQPVVNAVLALAADPVEHVRWSAVGGLKKHPSDQVAVALASRVPVESDDRAWGLLLLHPGLLTRAPELRDLLALWRRFSPADGSAPTWALSTALAVPSPSDGRARPDPAAGLDEAQRARLHRGVLRQAADAIAPAVAAGGSSGTDAGEAAALSSLRAWLDAPSDATRAAIEAELGSERNARHTDPHEPRLVHARDLLHAAVSGDLGFALRTGRSVVAEAARRDPRYRAVDAVRGPVVASLRALDVAHVLQLLAARLIRAGVDPLPSGPVLRLLPDGEDPVDAMRGLVTASECRADRNLAWLRLLMRPEDRERYEDTLRAAVARAAGAAALAELDAATDGAGLPDAAERVLVAHAERVVRTWLAQLVVDDAPPALRFASDGDRGGVGGTAAASAGDAAAAMRRLDPDERVRLWEHALDRARAWLLAGRRPGDVRQAPARRSDEALAGLERHDPRDVAAAADGIRALERAFRLVAAERVETWHLGVAAAAVDGHAWDADPLDDELGAGHPA
jgi:hypothetical protein